MQYHRPEDLKEAVRLLKRGRPLGGGTVLTPARRQLESVIDLQDLDLGEISLDSEWIHVGARVRLQQLLESALELPSAFLEVVRHETAWNLRNVATIGGLVVSADGRSPLLTALTAMDVELEIEPGAEQIDLVTFFDQRTDSSHSRLITRINAVHPKNLAYAQVARSPMDRPLVGACAARYPDGSIGLALGGFGDHPVQLLKREREMDPEGVGVIATKAYADAGDDFASAEYRSEVAAVLVKRVVKEVLA